MILPLNNLSGFKLHRNFFVKRVLRGYLKDNISVNTTYKYIQL